MNSKYILLFSFVFFFHRQVICQTFDIQIDDIENQWERPTSLIIDNDNTYVTIGSVCEDSITWCGTISSYDLNGSTNWVTLIEDFQIANRKDTSLDQDSLYITSHAGLSDQSRVVKLAIIEANTGDEFARYESPLSDEMAYLISNGHFVHNDLIYVYGNGRNVNDEFDKPGYIHVMDKRGNRIDEVFIRFEDLTVVRDVTVGEDGNYYLSIYGSVLGNPDRYNYILRFDPASLDYETIWSEKTSQSHPYFTTTSDGFVIVVDNTGFSELSFKGISYTGQELWEKLFDVENEEEGRRVISDIITAENGDILVATQIDLIFDNIAMIMRLTNSGNIIWEKVYPTYAQDGSGITTSNFNLIKESNDGSILAAGTNNDTKLFTELLQSNGRLIKIDGDGCYDSDDCDDELYEFYTSTEDWHQMSDQHVYLSPNPARTSLQLTSESPISRVIIRNRLGQEVLNLSDEFNSISTLSLNSLSQGLYAVSCWVDQSGWVTKKLIIE